MIESPLYLVCVDDSPESLLAVRFACARASMHGGNVTLVHVIAPADFQSLQMVAGRMEAEERANAEAMLERLSQAVQEGCGIVPSCIVRQGKVGEEILSVAMESLNAVMVVLATSGGSGRGTLAAWLGSQLGSKLFIPLLLVPGNLTDQQLQALL